MENKSIQISSSPVVKKVELGVDTEERFDFPGAMKLIIAGKTVTRVEWAEVDDYALLKDGVLTIHRADGTFYKWIVSEGDLTGVDWYVVN